MSLNDDALSDLNAERNNYITTPGQAADQTDSTSVIVVTQSGENGEPQQIETTDDQIVKKIEDDNAKVAILDNDVLKLTDLSEVSDQIMSAETIDQVQADRIEEVTGSLYENIGSRQEFTSSPTSTNLRETRKFVTNFSNEQIKDFEDRANAFRTEELAYMEALTQHLLTKCWPTVKNLLEDLSYLIMPNLRDIASSRKFVYTFPIKDSKTGELTGYTDPDNLVESRLCHFVYIEGINRIAAFDDAHEKMVQACVQLDAIFSTNPILKNLVTRITGNNDDTYEAALRQFMDIFYETKKATDTGGGGYGSEIVANPRIIDILNWYATIPLVSYIDKSLDGLTYGINASREVEQYLDESKTISEKIRRYSDILTDLNKLMITTTQYHRIISDLGRTIPHVKVILDFFVKYMNM